MGWLRNLFGADKANDAQVAATNQAVAGQTDALNYLKERDKVPGQVRDQSLLGLLEFFTGAGAPTDQQGLVDQAMASPLYKAIQGTKQGGLDAITRYASATGGLRSGNANLALAREGQRVDEDALLQSFNAAQGQQNQNLAGLLSLGGTPTNAAAIAQGTADIGNTKAQGTIARANTQNQATQNVFSTLLGLGSLASGAGWI